MTTQVQRNLPPGYVEVLGEDFASGITGAVDDAGNPLFTVEDSNFYVDPSTYSGNAANNFFTADMDSLQTDAQGLATDPDTGLGSYQDYLTNAEAFATAGETFFDNNGTAYQTNMNNANTMYGNAATQAQLQAAAAAAGQNAGATQYNAAGQALNNANNQFSSANTQYNNATNQYDLAAAAAAAGQNAGQPFFNQANQYSGANAYQQFMSPYQQQVIDATMAVRGCRRSKSGRRCYWWCTATR